MTRALRQLALLVAKDLRVELRTRHALALVAMLAALIVIVLGLGLDAHQMAGAFAAPAVLWVAYLFAGILCFEKTMAQERHDDALAALLLAPVDRSLIYAAKLITNLTLLGAVALLITAAGVLFFRFDLSPAPLGFALVVAVSLLGFAAVGTLFSAAVSSSSHAGGLLALAVFPVALPLVIASTHTLVDLFRDRAPITPGVLAVPAAFAVVYIVTSWIVFELVLEP